MVRSTVRNLFTVQMKRTVVSSDSRKRITPFKPTTTKTTTYRRRSTNPFYRPFTVRIPRSNPLPPMLQNTVKYTEVVNRTFTSGVASAYLFSCNGLFDPNISGTGHQPLYFDQLMALYNHYQVLKARIKVTFVPSASVVGPFLCGLMVDDDTTQTNSLNTSIGERPGAKQGMYQKDTHPSVVLYTSWDSKTLAYNAEDNPNIQGSSAANPAEQSYFVLETADIGGSNASMYMYVQIEYDVLWNELKDIATS